MNPPVEEWISYNRRKVEDALASSKEEEFHIIDENGVNVIIKTSPSYLLEHLKDAAKYMKDEIYFINLKIIERHC